MQKKETMLTVCDIFKQCQDLYERKRAEYQNTDDQFENFRQGAKLNQTNSINTLWGYVTKQIVSLAALVNKVPHDKDLMHEKAQDILVYMAILMVLLEEEDSE
jgi:hypothetical protein